MLDPQTLRDAFRRKRYGAGGYDPDFDLFDAAADEIGRLRAAGTTALEYLHGMQHLGSLVDQEGLARDIAKLEAAIGAVEQSPPRNMRGIDPTTFPVDEAES